MKKEIFIPTYEDKETGNIEYYCRLVNKLTLPDAKVVHIVNNDVSMETFLSLIDLLSLIPKRLNEMTEMMFGHPTATIAVKDVLMWGFKIYEDKSQVEICDFTEDDFIVLGAKKKKS